MQWPQAMIRREKSSRSLSVLATLREIGSGKLRVAFAVWFGRHYIALHFCVHGVSIFGLEGRKDQGRSELHKEGFQIAKMENFLWDPFMELVN